MLLKNIPNPLTTSSNGSPGYRTTSSLTFLYECIIYNASNSFDYRLSVGTKCPPRSLTISLRSKRSSDYRLRKSPNQKENCKKYQKKGMKIIIVIQNEADSNKKTVFICFFIFLGNI